MTRRVARAAAHPAAALAERGSVTAELALALPSLLVVVAVLLAAAQGLVVQLTCQDAARVAARAVVRGEPDGEVRRLAASVAPPGATVGLATGGDLVTVTVRAPVAAGPVARLLPGVRWQAHGTAVAAREPSP